MDDSRQKDLEKARVQQRLLHQCKTEPLKKVQSIRFHDGRHVAVMKVRWDWMELWPLNKAKLRPGEVVECDGEDGSGAACTVVLRIGGRCGPKGKWRRARKIKAIRKITVPLKDKDGG